MIGRSFRTRFELLPLLLFVLVTGKGKNILVSLDTNKICLVYSSAILYSILIGQSCRDLSPQHLFYCVELYHYRAHLSHLMRAR